MAHRTGQDRKQVTLFPVYLDQMVDKECLVRVIDLWVDSLDLVGLGFSKAVPNPLGQPPYAPGDLLKLYVWGFANGVRSSRKLEAACHGHVECLWLLAQLAPDHKTISNFRRENAQALVSACAAFVQFARQQKLLRGKTVAVDGTMLRAVSSSRWLATEDKLRALAQRNVEEVQAYLRTLDDTDVQEQSTAQRTPPKAARRALEKLMAEGARIDECLRQVVAEHRIAAVTSEPEARPMKKLHGAPGYNVQAAVDTETHLVVHQDVCTDANDRNQLAPVAQAASAAVNEPVTVVADSGYTNGHHIHCLEQQGITVAVPARAKSNKKGLLVHSAFTYERERDCFVCPEGKDLQYRKTNKGEMLVYMAKAGDCAACPSKAKCTEGKQRHVLRHPHQDAMDTAHNRWQNDTVLRGQRGCTVEHVFGTLKTQIMSTRQLLLRGLEGARIEIALATLAYNIKRTFNMKGAAWMEQAVGG